MFADNHTKEITLDTKCMGKFFLIKDEQAGPDELYPMKICYQPVGVLEQVCSRKSKQAFQSQGVKEYDFEADV